MYAGVCKHITPNYMYFLEVTPAFRVLEFVITVI